MWLATAYYVPAPKGGGYSSMMRVWRLTSVWRLSRTSGLNREQWGHRKTKIGTEVTNVTCDSDTIFKVKRSKVKVRGGGIVWRPHYRPHSLLDFGGDPNYDEDTGISKQNFYHCEMGKCYEFCWQLKKLSTNFYEFLEGGMSHLPKHSILILILMLIRIQEFLTGYLPLRIAKSLVIIVILVYLHI